MKLILLILISIITCSCDKEDLEAPPITKENTFSCKIDDELFVAQSHGGFFQLDGINVQFLENSWLLILGNGESDLYINLINMDSSGVRNIERSDGNRRFLAETNNVIEYAENRHQSISHVSHDDTGFINVLEWKNDSILIFEFDELILYDEDDPSRTITFTEGKLNINLATLNEQDM